MPLPQGGALEHLEFTFLQRSSRFLFFSFLFQFGICVKIVEFWRMFNGRCGVCRCIRTQVKTLRKRRNYFCVFHPVALLWRCFDRRGSVPNNSLRPNSWNSSSCGMSQLRGDKQKRAGANCRPTAWSEAEPERRCEHGSHTRVTSSRMDRRGEKKKAQVRAGWLFQTSEFICFGCGLMIQCRRPFAAVMCANTLLLLLLLFCDQATRKYSVACQGVQLATSQMSGSHTHPAGSSCLCSTLISVTYDSLFVLYVTVLKNKSNTCCFRLPCLFLLRIHR